MKLNQAISKVYDMSLYDGESDGLIQFKLGEDVHCYKLSKDYFDNYKDDTDIKNKKSIYVLYGKGKFYVGQAGIRNDDTAITSRIKEHLKDPLKDFVEEIVFFCHSDNRWDGGELDYLEASLIRYFKEQGFPMYKEQNSETIDPYLDTSSQFKYDKHFREIKIMLDILGYDSIRKIVLEKGNTQLGENTEIKTEPAIDYRKEVISVDNYNKILTMRKGKGEVCLQQLIDWGIPVSVKRFNFASYSVKNKHYWMEPSKTVLEEDWMFALFDNESKKIYLFIIPKDTYCLDMSKPNGLKIRKDKPELLKLEIKRNTYEDKQSGQDFTKFLRAEIALTVAD